MKKIIGLLIVIIVLAALIVPKVVDKINLGNATDTEENYITVEAYEALSGEISDYTYLAGTISANKTVNIIPTMPAIVENIEVQVGERIEEDAILFILDAKSVENQVELASLAMNSASASIEQANIGVSSANDSVKMAALAYDMAKANYEGNLEKYNFSRDNYEKYQQLYDEGLVSEAEYEQIKLQASDSTLVLLEKQLEQAAQSLEQSKLGVRNANISTKQASTGYQQAEINHQQAVDAKEDMIFKAPIDGIVTAINIDEDSFASNAAAAITIEDIDSVKVTTNVSEKIINRVIQGEKVQVFIDAIGEESFSGIIKAVSPSSDPRTMLYKVVIEVDNKDHIIKPGMFANIKLKLAQSSDHIVIKGSAVFNRDNINYVYIVEENIPRLKRVTVGIDTGDLVEITEGLEENTLYLTKGMEFITENTEIRVVRGDQ